LWQTLSYRTGTDNFFKFESYAHRIFNFLAQNPDSPSIGTDQLDNDTEWQLTTSEPQDDWNSIADTLLSQKTPVESDCIRHCNKTQ